MKEVKTKKITLEDLVDTYTLHEDDDRCTIMFTIKPEQRIKLMLIGFQGNEEIIGLILRKNKNGLEYKVWYKDGSTFVSLINYHGLPEKIISDMVELVQRLANKISDNKFINCREND